jgi:uncharacterized protein
MTIIRANTVLPANRRPVRLTTSDGLTLVGELALPEPAPAKATLICLHPLPTHGGMMDSHLLRKAAWRLPALADIAVLRFNTRGTSSAAGTSEGAFDGARSEQFDVEAAIEFAISEGLPEIWVLGWSFGTDLALRYARSSEVRGLLLLSPPLRYSQGEDLQWWNNDGRPIAAFIPEHDDFLRPAEAVERFAIATNVDVVSIDNGKHLWIGESFVTRALTEIVSRLNPSALPLPTEWDGPFESFQDLEPVR